MTLYFHHVHYAEESEDREHVYQYITCKWGLANDLPYPLLQTQGSHYSIDYSLPLGVILCYIHWVLYPYICKLLAQEYEYSILSAIVYCLTSSIIV